jgi:hypothetical protein
VSCAVWLLLPNVAVRWAVWVAVTADVGMENVAELLPNGIATEAGGCAALLSLET